MHADREQIAASILKFLKNEHASSDLNSDLKGSLEAGIQSLEKAFGLTPEIYSDAPDLYDAILSPTIDIQKSEEYKNKGNELMAKNEFAKALEAYSEAVKYDHTNCILYGNRSAAYLKLERFMNAIEDGMTAISLNPKYHKGYGRVGYAYLALKEYNEARKFFEQALELQPNDPTYKEKVLECSSKSGSSQQNQNAPDLSSLITDPSIIQTACEMMNNPEFRNIMSGVAENLCSNNQSGQGVDFQNMFQSFQDVIGNMGDSEREELKKLGSIFRPQDPPAST